MVATHLSKWRQTVVFWWVWSLVNEPVISPDDGKIKLSRKISEFRSVTGGNLGEKCNNTMWWFKTHIFWGIWHISTSKKGQVSFFLGSKKRHLQKCFLKRGTSWAAEIPWSSFSIFQLTLKYKMCNPPPPYALNLDCLLLPTDEVNHLKEPSNWSQTDSQLLTDWLC